ncbi:hypothetical protein BH23ACT11_BH23ACT11_19410 [soil metagenome]
MGNGQYADVALRLSVLEDRFAICRLKSDTAVPDWALEDGFCSITRTPDELSIVCREQNVPEGLRAEDGWRALKVDGPLDLSLTGVLASILEPLAEAGISIFALSTFDTDYILVRDHKLEDSIAALREAGHRLQVPKVLVRPATWKDEAFLWNMLYEAVHWNPAEAGPKPTPDELLSEPGLRRYLDGWGREDDFAVVALDVESGERIGAAWYRTFPADEPGYGFVDEATPEIAIAVAPNQRSAGVGGALMHALMDAARSNGFEAMSLKVQKSNNAAVRLYERKDFVGGVDAGDAWIMKADLHTSGVTRDAPCAPRMEENCH